MIGGGFDYCENCARDGLPCADGKPGMDGTLCPLHDLPADQDAQALLNLILDHAPLLGGENCAAELDRLSELAGLDLETRRTLVPAAALAVLQGRADAREKETS